MKQKLLVPSLVAVIGVLAALGSIPAAASSGAVVQIRHQVHGCHAWSVNGGRFAARQSVVLRRGATVTFMNNDVMPHRLIQLAGPHVGMHNGSTMPMGAGMHRAAGPGLMNHMGATTSLTLDKPGIYRFGTKAGEDYMRGFETTGPDNVLRLTITVR